MASFFRFLFFVCIAVIYCTKSSHCLPTREARMPTPSLEKICRDSVTNPVVKSHRLLCFLCKGFDISCFSSSTTSTASPTSSSTSAPSSSSSVTSTSLTTSRTTTTTPATTPTTSTSETE